MGYRLSTAAARSESLVVYHWLPSRPLVAKLEYAFPAVLL
jgi:hypothetical protein